MPNITVKTGLAGCALLLSLLPLWGTAIAETRPDASPRAELIPRAGFFGKLNTFNLKLGPDGETLAFFRPIDGVPNLWVAPLASPERAKPLTRDDRRGFEDFRWSPDGGHILLTSDISGEEHWQVSALNMETGRVVDLTDDPSLRTKIIKLSEQFPGEALIAFNERDARYHDVYRVNLDTGERRLVFENRGRFTDFIADGGFNLRLALRVNPDGSTSYFRLGDGEPQLVTSMPLGDLRSSKVLDLADGDSLLMYDSRGSNYANLVSLDLGSGEVTTLVTAKEADIVDTLRDGPGGELLAVREDPLVSQWRVVDPAVQPELDAIGAATGRSWEVAGQTPDGRKWIIYAHSGSAPSTYSLWDRDREALSRLYVTAPELDRAPLAETTPVLIPSRDGLALPSYLTLPRGLSLADFEAGRERIPLVLSIHGGPWLRDRDHFHRRWQWLANRGYAVLAVNYRGSVGFGRDFVVAADREWAGTMHNDLVDAVDWAVEQGVASPDEVALFGLSYGGYSALVALTFTPDRFACAVDIAGPSDLNRLLNAMPEWWTFQRPQFTNRIGDPDKPAGARDLLARSPVSRVDRIKGPLLIGQGTTDPRVLREQSDLMARAMEARGKAVTYVLFPGEGHVFYRQQTDIAFAAVAEQFLSQCLGGRAEPFGSSLEGSRMIVKSGGSRIEGLEEAMAGGD